MSVTLLSVSHRSFRRPNQFPLAVLWSSPRTQWPFGTLFGCEVPDLSLASLAFQCVCFPAKWRARTHMCSICGVWWSKIDPRNRRGIGLQTDSQIKITWSIQTETWTSLWSLRITWLWPRLASLAGHWMRVDSIWLTSVTELVCHYWRVYRILWCLIVSLVVVFRVVGCSSSSSLQSLFSCIVCFRYHHWAFSSSGSSHRKIFAVLLSNHRSLCHWFLSWGGRSLLIVNVTTFQEIFAFIWDCWERVAAC